MNVMDGNKCSIIRSLWTKKIFFKTGQIFKQLIEKKYVYYQFPFSYISDGHIPMYV